MRTDTALTASTLTGLSALHVGWGLGSSFPCADRADLADTVAGSTKVPPPGECFAVAAALLAAAALVADLVPASERLRRPGVAAVAFVLGGRGVLGLAGRTGTVVPWDPSERFERLDRRYYGPLCLALSAGAFASLRAPRRPSQRCPAAEISDSVDSFAAERQCPGGSRAPFVRGLVARSGSSERVESSR